jgi:TolA-binding protein
VKVKLRFMLLSCVVCLVSGVLVSWCPCLLVSGHDLTLITAQEAYAQDAREEEVLFIAKKAMDDGFYDTAMSLLANFLGDYPDSSNIGEANLLIGECYFHQNRFLDALKKFEELLSSNASLNIKDSVYYWIAEVHFKGNNFIKAASYYKKIIDEFPKSNYVPGAYYSLGWCNFQGQKFKEALEYFNLSQDKFADYPQAQDAGFKAIECLYNLKDYPGLKKEVNLYFRRYPKDTDKSPYLYFYMAEADYYLNNFADAVDGYSKVTANVNDQRIQSLSRLGMAWAYLKLKQYPKSEEIFLSLKSDNLEKDNLYYLFLGKAALYFETNRHLDAIKVYDDLLSIVSNPLVLAQAYLGKAEIYSSLKEFSESAKVCREALDKIDQGLIPPEAADKVHYAIATALLKQGDFEEAIREFQIVYDKSEDKMLKVSALSDMAEALQGEGKYAKAVQIYKNISKDFKNSYYPDYIQYQLGLSLVKSNDYDQAISVLKDFSRQFPGSKMLPDAYYSLGLAYFQKQDYSSSRDIFMKFPQYYKDSDLEPESMYLLASSLYGLGNFPEAVKAFKDIIDLYGQNSELVQKAEYQIADCYYQMGEEKEAMNRFNALRSKYPQSRLTPEVIWWLGEYYYQNNDLSLSRRYFLSLVQDFPQSDLIPDARYILGAIYTQEGSYPEAIDNYLSVIDSKRQDLTTQAIIRLADVYAKNNELEKALDMYGKSLEFVRQAEIAGIRFKKAEILQALSRTKEAKEEYLRVLDLPHENDDYIVKSLFRLGQIYEDNKERKEAFKVYEKIVLMQVPESKYAQEKIDLLKLK